jgi:hypothetical protein
LIIRVALKASASGYLYIWVCPLYRAKTSKLMSLPVSDALGLFGVR